MNKKIIISAIIGILAILGIIIFSRGVTDTSEQTNEPQSVNAITHGHGLAIDVEDSNKVYIATHHGLLGLINDKELYQVGKAKDDYMGFSTHPTIANVFYSSGHPSLGGNIGFQKSEDGGISWKKLSNGVNGPVDFHAMAISPVNPNLIYGWYNGSLQQSMDGGNNWMQLNTTLTNVIALTADTKNENTIYAATTQGGLISKDKGLTWSDLSADIKNKAVAAIAVNPSDSAKLLSFSEQLGLAKSEDSGVTWKSVNERFAEDAALFIAYDKKNPAVVYVLTHKNSLYKSMDAGEKWQKIR